MRSGRWLVGVAVLAGGIGLTTGIAGADEVTICQSAASCVPQELQTKAPASPSNQGPSGVMPATETRTGAPASAAPASVEATSATAPSGSLPVTGGDVLGLALIGGAALGAGVVLTRRARAQA